jgi:hypothetical protein
VTSQPLQAVQTHPGHEVAFWHCPEQAPKMLQTQLSRRPPVLVVHWPGIAASQAGSLMGDVDASVAWQGQTDVLAPAQVPVPV